MAKKKNFYAVKVGAVTGIFETWEECLKYTSGYPNAQFQGFYTEEEAVAYLASSKVDTPSSSAEEAPQNPSSPDEAIAYVDGTYNPDLKRYGYGVVFVSSETGKHIENGYGDDTDKIEHRNVTGEILGALTAMRLAVQGGFSKLTLCYDYEGIEKWVTGEWKAKNDLSKEYVAKANVYLTQIEINFYHTRAHSGILLNEEADQLANLAIQKSANIARGVVTSGSTWMTIAGVNEEEITCILSLMSEEKSDFRYRKITENGIDKYSLILNAEKLTVMHYKNTAKICVQGNQGNLYNFLISFLGELIDPHKITTTLNTYYDIQIPDERVDRAFGYYLPSVSKLPNVVLTLVRQSLYNTLLQGKMYDYGHLVTPALRALEYHVKSLLNQHEISTSEGFTCFEKTANRGKRYQLNQDARDKIRDSDTICHINDSYNFIVMHRHTLLHAEPGIGEVSDVRLVSNQEEAKSLILKALAIINEYHETLAKKQG